MGIKLFAFLGTSNYKETEYFFDDGSKNLIRTYKTPYIQEALAKLLDEPELEVIIFITEDANKKNWVSEDKVGLKNRLENINVKFKAVGIPNGKSNSEVWEIFKIVYDEIEENDRIYVDVTQSFRSIPIIFMSVLNHAKVAKKCDIRRILYGAYEASIDGRAPIYDLTLFNQITEWSSGVEQLLSIGECDMFCSIVNKSIKPILAEAKGTDELINLTRECSNYIKEFYTDLKLCRAQSIQTDGKKLYEVLGEIKKQNTSQYRSVQPFFNLLEKIEIQVSFFNNNNIVDNTLECTKLCRDFGHYQQAYTFLLENIVNYICVKAELDWTQYGDERKKAENIIRSKYLKGCCITENEKMIMENKLKDFTVEMAELHRNLGEVRNDLNHAEFRRDAISKKKIVNNLDLFIGRFINLYLK